MQKKINAIVFEEPGKAAVRSFEIPKCGDDEVATETIYSFVSPGTELRVFSGRSESKGKFPVIPGYSWVGKITEVGKNVKGWDKGELVSGRGAISIPGYESLWGAQASHHNCAVSGYCALVKLPQGADPWHYTPVEVGAIASRGTSVAYPAKGETAVVIGQGLIGLLAARWLISYGVRVIVCDLEEFRLEKSRKLGVAYAINGRTPDIKERILSLCPPGADIVIEASSSQAGADIAASILRQPTSRSLNVSYNPEHIRSNACFWPRLVYLASYIEEKCPLPGVEGAVVLRPGDRTSLVFSWR
ncbi:MAG: zinc-binding dehydrogenase [Lentisphaerae bacterium]|nr:zinc-binding dehydrogenase [Lentisphaerota bacterium]